MKIVGGSNYYHNISFSRSLLYAIKFRNFFNAGLIFTPKVFIPYKKVWAPSGKRAEDREFWYTNLSN